LDFTYAIMFIITTSMPTNLVSIVFGLLELAWWLIPYWPHLSPFDLF
jgi:hypothetical protein